MSYVDLLNVPYPQAAPKATNIDHSHLTGAVGSSASLLSTKKTLDLYLANVKKNNDPAIQYDFAIFMITAAQDMLANGAPLTSPRSPRHGQSSPSSPSNESLTPDELLHHGRTMLQRLADRSYPFAQYYLADGLSSGLLNKNRPDNSQAFSLFVAASKHGHAESSYRAALCYEFGWGTRKDVQKSVQFYRQAASRNHPGAMSRLGKACLIGDFGLIGKQKEGVKWLKRAAEAADLQYNSAPYELGVLHEQGYGEDIFKDEVYAVQLFTQAADLGHVEAAYRLGDAYEHGTLKCPKDTALSVNYYSIAANGGHGLAMMGLCAWFLVGAEPVLQRDEAEAYEWARRSAETGGSIVL
jgi:TPR repeat protein